MNITPITLYILKRKIKFISSLLDNEATREMMQNGIHRSLNDVISYLGVTEMDANSSGPRYMGILKSRSLAKIKEIELMEDMIRESELVKAIKFLLDEKNEYASNTLRYLLDPRRAKRK